ncbi:hypothetical protein B0H14DRAFT_3479955 [Mycena olivaceomarginata]|nr:hypothetical protein B0H14DRAFT_3479955 [Mycena olivaceomarginata]
MCFFFSTSTSILALAALDSVFWSPPVRLLRLATRCTHIPYDFALGLSPLAPPRCRSNRGAASVPPATITCHIRANGLHKMAPLAATPVLLVPLPWPTRPPGDEYHRLDLPLWPTGTSAEHDTGEQAVVFRGTENAHTRRFRDSVVT